MYTTMDATGRLPKQKRIDMILDKAAITFSESVDNSKPLVLSYFNMVGWSHSSKTLRLVESLPDGTQREYNFATFQGAEIIDALEDRCRSILVDMQEREAAAGLADEDKLWNDVDALPSTVAVPYEKGDFDNKAEGQKQVPIGDSDVPRDVDLEEKLDAPYPNPKPNPN